jgi:hypothetical protein
MADGDGGARGVGAGLAGAGGFLAEWPPRGLGAVLWLPRVLGAACGFGVFAGFGAFLLRVIGA